MRFKLTKNMLNFNVYNVPKFPTGAGTENDIAIITSTPMSNWILSPDKPYGIPRSDGDVWLQYSVSGNTFNALKQNTMLIAIISAWQYVNGAWANVEAAHYQGGEWVEWESAYYLFNSGDECEDITGGWTVGNAANSNWSKGTDSIIVGYNGSESVHGWVASNNPLDVKDFSKLYVDVTVTGFFNATTSPGLFGLNSKSNLSGSYLASNFEVCAAFTTSGIHCCDISGVNVSTLYVVVGSAWKGKIHRIWLE